MRLVAHHSQNGTHLELFLGRRSVNDSLGLARLLLSEGFEPLGVVKADFSSCPFLTSVVLPSEEVQLEREGTDSSQDEPVLRLLRHNLTHSRRRLRELNREPSRITINSRLTILY